MATSNLEVFVAAFSSEDEAGATLKDFRAMHREGDIDLIDAAVIVHTAEGKVHFHETADPGAKRWAARGAIAGGLIGLIFPPSILAGAAVGAAGGGIWGKVRDKGFSDEDLRAIGESIPPGSSAIIAVAEDRVLETLQRGIEGYRKIERRALDADASAQIVAAVEEESGAEG
ncbi:MAG TPA: DUF1269 domain-containing protein [Solirubrobacteraceae bacterium]|nr:DUF1269 domain-containing protein [Solirubrobacteraceae bacterium]